MTAAKKKSKKQSASDNDVQAVVVRQEPERTLFSWQAQSRPFKPRNREFWVSIFAIAAVVSFILFIIEGAISVILIVSILFLFYVLSTVKPDIIDYSITNRGIYIGDKRTSMDLLIRYWFTKRLDTDVIVFDTVVLPGRIELVIDPKDREQIKKVLSVYLVEEKGSPDKLEKAAGWLSKKIPANK